MDSKINVRFELKKVIYLISQSLQWSADKKFVNLVYQDIELGIKIIELNEEDIIIKFAQMNLESNKIDDIKSHLELFKIAKTKFK
jgi:hypothetical protein